MKYYIFLILLFLPSVVFLQEAGIPPVLDLQGVEINWVYLVEDTNLIEVLSSTSTRYSNGSPRSLISNENYIYLFNQSRNSRIDFDGFDLYMLDNLTGELVHTLNYDSYSGAGNYYLFNNLSNISFQGDGNLEILGYQSLDTLLPLSEDDFPELFFFSTPVRFEIKSDDLSIIERQTGLNTNMDPNFLYNYITPGKGDLMKDKSDNYIHVERKGIIEDDFLKEVIYFSGLDEGFSIDTSYVNRIDFESNIQTNLLQLSSPTRYNLINDSTLMTINFKKTIPDVTQSPEVALLSIYSISSFENIELLHTRDITDFFVKDDGVHFFYRNIISDKIILSQTSFDESQSPSGLDAHSWLAVFDLNAELIYSYTDFGDNELKYERLTPLLIKNEELVFGITYTLETETGFDIFKVNLASDEPPEYVTRISQVNDQTFKFFRIGKPLEISEDNFVFLIHGRYDYIDQRTADMTYVVSVDLENLISNSTQQNPKMFDLPYKLFPNPALNDLHITFEEEFSGRLEVFTSTGKLSLTKEVNNQINVVFDTSNLASGPYIIKLNDPNGNILKSSVFIKD